MRKYSAYLFIIGVVTNFLFRNFYLLLPGAILTLAGIWSAPCLFIGLGLLGLDLALSVTEQIRIRKTAISQSDSPEFDEMMDALCGPGGLGAFRKIVESKCSSEEDDTEPKEE